MDKNTLSQLALLVYYAGQSTLIDALELKELLDNFTNRPEVFKKLLFIAIHGFNISNEDEHASQELWVDPIMWVDIGLI